MKALISSLMLLADLLSLSRVPLGVGFLWLVAKPWTGIALIAAAALTDVLDGWVARHAGPKSLVHRRGDWLDPLCDKIFVAFVLVALARTFRAPTSLVALLIVRDILQVASLLIYAAVPPLRKRGPYNFRANLLGKLTTGLQFGTATVILFGRANPWIMAFTTAVVGCASLVAYISRVIPPTPSC